ncbi:MAG: UDP-glucose 6-dehydrogenase, partial [Deltaproteobacteria bacterium RIFCSPLOWO2_01_FULL_38_9]
GYVGLVAGTCFADSGNQVYCVDVDKTKIKNLSCGIVPFYEPGLEDLIKRNTKNKRLTFTIDSALAIQQSKVIFIAVGTPQDEDGSSDLKYVFNVARTIAEHMNESKIIVLKSTVPVGTHQKVSDILQKNTSHPFAIISNPEFLKEGTAIEDFLKPERVVLGGNHEEALNTLKELYAPFVRSGNPIFIMDNTSAELSKYACNSFLAAKISFINEIANFCESVGADIEPIRQVMMSDSRIGHKFLYPGTGYGGSCFPKDVQALLASSQIHGKSLKVLQAVEEVNRAQKEILFHKLYTYFSGKLSGKTIAIWGLAFKPNTDDMREAPAIAVIKNLLKHKAKIKVYDPVALLTAKHIFENKIEYFEDSYECLKDADALLILTEWNEFRKPNFKKIKSLLTQPLIFDGRNLFNPKMMKEYGFYYEGIGLI